MSISKTLLFHSSHLVCKNTIFSHAIYSSIRLRRYQLLRKGLGEGGWESGLNEEGLVGRGLLLGGEGVKGAG